MALNQVIAALVLAQSSFTSGSPNELVSVQSGTATRTVVGARVSGNGYAVVAPLGFNACYNINCTASDSAAGSVDEFFYIYFTNFDVGSTGTYKHFFSVGAKASDSDSVADGDNLGLQIGADGKLRFTWNGSNAYAQIGSTWSLYEVHSIRCKCTPADASHYHVKIWVDGVLVLDYANFPLNAGMSGKIAWCGFNFVNSTAVFSGYSVTKMATADTELTPPITNMIAPPSITQLKVYADKDAPGGADGSADDTAHSITFAELAQLVVPSPTIPWVKPDNTTWDLSQSAYVTFGQYRYGQTADPTKNPTKLTSPGLVWNGVQAKLRTSGVIDAQVAGTFSLESSDGTLKVISGENPITTSATQPDAASWPAVWCITDSNIVDGALFEDGKVMRLVAPDGVAATVNSSGATITATTSVFTAALVNGVITRVAGHAVSFTIASRSSGTVVTVDRAPSGGEGTWSSQAVKIFAQDPTLSCTESGVSYASINAALTAIPGAHVIIGNKCYFSTFDGQAPSTHTYTRTKALGRSTNRGSLEMIYVPYRRLVAITGGMNAPVGSSSATGSNFGFDTSCTLCIADCSPSTRGGYYAGDWSPGSAAAAIPGRLLMINSSCELQPPIDQGDGTPYWFGVAGTGASFIARSQYSADNNAQDNQFLIINDDPIYPGFVIHSDILVGTVDGGRNNTARATIFRSTDDGTVRNFQFSVGNIYYSSFCNLNVDRSAVVSLTQYQLGTSGSAAKKGSRSLMAAGVLE